jgi:hypothetical protein
MKFPCPQCGALAIREGASKCPACKAWVGAKPRYPLGKGGVLAVALGFMAMGAIAGALGTAVALSGHARSQPPAPPAPSAAPVVSASAMSSSSAEAASAAPSASAEAPPAKVSFGEPRAIKLDYQPVDAVVTDDDATAIVLADDGGLHAINVADGHEIKKIGLNGRATELRLLSSGRVITLGAAGPLHLVDLSSWVVQKVDVGGAPLDALEVGDPPSLIVASSSRRLSRFSNALKPEGQVTLARPIAALVELDPGNGKSLVAVLEQGRRGGPAGAIELFDGLASPFAGARSSVTGGSEPRRGAQHTKGATLFVVDKATAQLLEVSADHPTRSAGVGKAPVAVYRLGDRWAVTLDAGGTAHVSDLKTSLEPTKTIALGGAVSRAAPTPDGRALFVALGGGAKERGDKTVLLAGEPPALARKFTTGAGSHAVSVGRSGKVAIVAAYWGRTVTVISAR